MDAAAQGPQPVTPQPQPGGTSGPPTVGMSEGDRWQQTPASHQGGVRADDPQLAACGLQRLQHQVMEVWCNL